MAAQLCQTLPPSFKAIKSTSIDRFEIIVRWAFLFPAWCFVPQKHPSGLVGFIVVCLMCGMFFFSFSIPGGRQDEELQTVPCKHQIAHLALSPQEWPLRLCGVREVCTGASQTLGLCSSSQGPSLLQNLFLSFGMSVLLASFNQAFNWFEVIYIIQPCSTTSPYPAKGIPCRLAASSLPRQPLNLVFQTASP